MLSTKKWDMKRLRLLFLAAVLVGAAGCGSDDTDSGEDSSGPSGPDTAVADTEGADTGADTAPGDAGSDADALSRGSSPVTSSLCLAA